MTPTLRTCGCGQLVGARNTSGRCKSCAIAHLNADPAIRRRRENGLREAGKSLSPEAREKRRQQGKWLHRQFLSNPELVARLASPEIRAKAGRAITEAKIGWCPPELRDHYRYITQSLRYSKVEARAIIEAEIPGTEQHTLRMIANRLDAKRIATERERREAY